MRRSGSGSGFAISNWVVVDSSSIEKGRSRAREFTCTAGSLNYLLHQKASVRFGELPRGLLSIEATLSRSCIRPLEMKFDL